MNLAAIDIGTNSVRLLVSRHSRSGFTSLERKMKITRIGRNLIESGVISNKTVFDTLKVLSEYRDLMESYHVKRYKAVGTSALRKAQNGEWFKRYILDGLGMEIDIISGNEEAQLSYYGAIGDLYATGSSYHKRSEDSFLVMDIGGGSSELIVGQKGTEPALIKSIDLGCVSLTERFISEDSLSKRQMEDLKKFIRKKLSGTIDEISAYKLSGVIGVAGTITTLAAIDQKMETYDSDAIHNYVLSLTTIKDIFDYLCNLGLEERKRVAGLQPGRADIIVCGTAILIEILEMLGQDEITVSERDILDGIIYTLAYF